MTLLSKSFHGMDSTWQAKLSDELDKPYMQQLEAFLEREEVSGCSVFPPRELIFNAFAKTPFDQVSVVIIGQDPYHGEGQAEGLSFSVPPGSPLPPSLKNIFKELQSDLQAPYPPNGSLVSWAEQGVFLLNAVLTVREGQANSHRAQGWEIFTVKVVELLAQRERPLVFLLWGKPAFNKFHPVIAAGSKNHLVLVAPHPSPLSAYTGFLGCKHFSKANQFLREKGQKPIDWAVPLSL